MSTALPQSIAEKSAARILRLCRSTITHQRKQADSERRFIRRCCPCPYRVSLTRTVCARHATCGRSSRHLHRSGLVLRDPTRLEFRGGRSGRRWGKTRVGERGGGVWGVCRRRGGGAGGLHDVDFDVRDRRTVHESASCGPCLSSGHGIATPVINCWSLGQAVAHIKTLTSHLAHKWRCLPLQ
jgi:hypothetical protein